MVFFLIWTFGQLIITWHSVQQTFLSWFCFKSSDCNTLAMCLNYGRSSLFEDTSGHSLCLVEPVIRQNCTHFPHLVKLCRKKIWLKPFLKCNLCGKVKTLYHFLIESAMLVQCYGHSVTQSNVLSSSEYKTYRYLVFSIFTKYMSLFHQRCAIVKCNSNNK